MLAVYKPRSGEAPLWDFEEGTLAAREVAAYVVADGLGWPWVPPTVLRDGPQGPGSVQRFVAFDPSQHFLTMQRDHADEFRRIALFDVVANNADRKSGHCLLAEDGTDLRRRPRRDLPRRAQAPDGDLGLRGRADPRTAAARTCAGSSRTWRPGPSASGSRPC